MPSYDAGDGRRLSYLDAGPRDRPAGRPLVLLHGWGCDGGLFEGQLAALSGRRRVIAPDLRGHRHSWRAGDAPDIGLLADDLQALLAQLDGPAPVVLGWSMGALVAFELLRRRGSGALGGLVVLDMTPRVANDTDWKLGLLGGYRQSQAEKAAATIRAHWDYWVETFLPSVFAAGRAPDPALLERVGASMRGCDPAAMAALWRAISAADYRAILPSLDLPTLILRGAGSQLYGPETAEWLAGTIPGAELSVIERAGHAPHLEQPAAFDARLAAFLERL
ncbi:Pimeloyl-ACP methyl ester carboxylesterase [Tistlia consotensis]|uniref:Pimeloyl-ACP methyl ester carboxylesterase n=1 Tax=Tistlia consotensis USBA 355 TaxID=560819 RepID=A0A1Y6B4T5_9PROT|nr:alpha/beta hydrolase [Tistlia consotensis]SME92074.1 Pimeloyl-ACP methyl ester carboxylesterase [Tistlia consotensis USBA 355]SNR27815.1 Pimeloyl-ACP methyl ester carboxylesterase [Tistlia consotensis]